MLKIGHFVWDWAFFYAIDGWKWELQWFSGTIVACAIYLMHIYITSLKKFILSIFEFNINNKNDGNDDVHQIKKITLQLITTRICYIAYRYESLRSIFCCYSGYCCVIQLFDIVLCGRRCRLVNCHHCIIAVVMQLVFDGTYRTALLIS